MYERYFPWGIALGQAFLGREAEICELENNIQNGYHSLILAPRRFGKTSLAKHVIEKMGLPFIEIDLFIAQDELAVEQKFLKGVQGLISTLSPPEHWFKTLMNYFKQANKTWTVGIKGLRLELSPENHKDVPQNILDALNALEHVLAKKKQKAVMFIDEFQEISNIKINRALEGAIRHFAQNSKYVLFIFSGSSQHMLQHMFNDRERPLYALCDTIRLEKLPRESYEVYLNKIARKTFKQPLKVETFDRIMQVTQKHPRYVYYLCRFLWEKHSAKNKNPTPEDVSELWGAIIKNKLKDTKEILSQRALGQIKILTLIASGHNTEITGQQALSQLGISGSAVTQALKILERDDLVEKHVDGSYHIIDPLIQSTLAEYAARDF